MYVHAALFWFFFLVSTPLQVQTSRQNPDGTFLTVFAAKSVTMQTSKKLRGHWVGHSQTTWAAELEGERVNLAT